MRLVGAYNSRGVKILPRTSGAYRPPARPCGPLATKMPIFNFKSGDGPEKLDAYFAEQLEKCGVDYFDYYLLHSLDAGSYEGEVGQFAALHGLHDDHLLAVAAGGLVALAGLDALVLPV